MFTKRYLKNSIKELNNTLVMYKDLYRQASSSRDFWQFQSDTYIHKIGITQNKLRDEKDLCDQLAEFVDFVSKNYHHITPADVKRARTLSQIYKEARNVK